MKSPYELDRLLGLDHFITSTRGIGGKLRSEINDFQVEETYEESRERANGEYTHFVLEKRNWSTMTAIKAIARTLGVSHKRFGYAGTKDKRALTRQRVAVWRVEPRQLKKVMLRGIKLSDFKKSDQRISLGNVIGNRFKLVIRGIELAEDELEGLLSETAVQLKERGVPNYFGYQRFGIVRPNTHLVGKELIKGNLRKAVMAYLTNPFETEREDAREARRFLQETGNYKKALDIFPKRLGYERSMLDALSKNPRDYAGALRRLPKKLRWMFVHAYQGFLFNKILSRVIEEGMEIKGQKIPLFGYRSSLSEGFLGEIEKKILEEENVFFKDFKIAPMPELSSEGLLRDGNIEVQPNFKIEKDELNAGKLKCAMEFELQKGSYATVVLREFMKTSPLNY